MNNFLLSKSNITEYLQSLMNSKRLGAQVVFQTVLPKTPALWPESITQYSPKIQEALRAVGIRRLYLHQGQAIDKIRSGRNVIVATPTAAIYDGDTSACRRKRIREAPPNVILTNPEMLHLSFLAHHRKWEHFFKNLQTVVVDEVHTYRGVMGSHIAQIFRRFHRICRRYGASPTFVFSSATVADPARLARQLTGQSATAITESGAPRGNSHLVFVNPETGPAVFIYDAIPGGAGLNREAFKRADRLLKDTLNAIQGCGCKSGCPSCVQSPKCGSGNRPIDKAAAIFILEQLKHGDQPYVHKSHGLHPQKHPASPIHPHKKASHKIHYGVFDLETQRSAAEVGGWHRAELMKISCADRSNKRMRIAVDWQ